MKITEALLAEHVVFHNLFDHIETTLPKLKTLGEVHALAGVLEATLEAHSQVEDQLLIEPLGHCFAQISQQETFHDEHEEIDEQLKAALNCRTLKTARRLLLNVVVASRNHFDKEERLVFPMAEKALNSRTLTTLGETWMRQRKAAHG
jgi:hemerythrin-like domain-containing protein